MIVHTFDWIAPFQRLAACAKPAWATLFILLLPATALAQSFLQGTTIVVLKTPSEIYVGADSLGTRHDGTSSRPESTCKIVQADNLFFYAVANISEDPETNFSVSTLVKYVISKGKTFKERVGIFEKATIAPLEKTLSNIKSKYRGLYLKEFQRKEALSIIFFGRENGALVLATVTFSASDPNPTTVHIKSNTMHCIGNCLKDTFPIFAGRFSNIAEITKSNPLLLTQLGPEKFVSRLIQIEIAANPETVGHPIDIIHVTTESTQWIQRKDQCPEIQDQPAHKPKPTQKPKKPRDRLTMPKVL